MTVFPQDKEYFGALDTLRFLAFLCVFISHIFVFSTFQFSGLKTRWIITYLLTQGNLGVSFFFVLSGFLITYLLLKEINRKGEISVAHFYIRRVLRIWPIYFIVTGVGFLILPALFSLGAIFGLSPEYVQGFAQGTEWYRLPWYIFFVANFDMIVHGPAAFFLAVLWSISVEEQFYLVWPWLLTKGKYKKIIVFGVLGCILSVIYRYAYFDNLNIVRCSTVSFISDLMTGAIGAYAVFHFQKIKEWFISRGKYFGVVLCILLPILFILFKYIERQSFFGDQSVRVWHILYACVPQVTAIYFLVVILYSCFNTYQFVHGWIQRKLQYLGQISYGLYCYHCFGILLLKIVFSLSAFEVYKNTLTGFWLGAVLAFWVTVLLAHVSYVYVEKRILRLKERFW